MPLRRTFACVFLTALTLLTAACHPADRLVPAYALADETTPIACTGGTFSLARATPTVMLVLDRSGSMSTVATRSVGASRWVTLTDALATVLPRADTMALGALLFPAGAASSQVCVAPALADVSPATGNAAAIVAALRASEPVGQTPTADALVAAAAQFDEAAPAARARALVLATDGAPDCNLSLDPATCTCTRTDVACTAGLCLDDARTVATVAELAAGGLPTWVIGLEDTANPALVATLDRLAVAGGRPVTGAAHAWVPATSPSQLEGALDAIRTELQSCDWVVDSVPDTGGGIVVTVDGQTVPWDPSGVDGWSWGSRARGEVVFRGAACTALTARAAPVVQAVVQCGE